VAFGEAGNAFDFDLLGTLSIAPVTTAPDSTTLFASIADAKIVSREPGGQTELDKIAAELRSAGCFLTLAGGRIVGYRWPRGMSATAANVYRSIGAGLQFARAANGSQRYTAEEYDGTGRYVAEYAADAEQGVWHKRKLKYVDLLTIKGTSTDSPLRIVPAVVSSQGTVALSPEGRPEIIAAEDEVDVKGAQAPVHARTVFSLRGEPGAPRRQAARDWNALVASTQPVAADEAYDTGTLLKALDKARINGMTFAEVLARLDQLAKGRGSATAQGPINGKALSPDQQATGEHSVQEDQRLFEALAAIYRQDPQAIGLAMSKIRARSPIANVLVDAMGAAGTPAAQTALVELMNSKSLDAPTRARAGTTLARTSNPEDASIDALKALLVDHPFKAKALFGLGTYSRRLRDAGHAEQARELGEFLVARLPSANSEHAVLTVLRAIANSGYAGALPHLTRYLGDERPLVRGTALRALQSMRDPKVDGILASGLTSDPSGDVRVSALDAAKNRDPSDAMAQALAAVAASEPDTHVRYRAVELMGDWLTRRPDLRPTLEQIAQNDEEPRVRLLARNAL